MLLPSNERVYWPFVGIGLTLSYPAWMYDKGEALSWMKKP